MKTTILVLAPVVTLTAIFLRPITAWVQRLVSEHRQRIEGERRQLICDWRQAVQNRQEYLALLQEAGSTGDLQNDFVYRQLLAAETEARNRVIWHNGGTLRSPG